MKSKVFLFGKNIVKLCFPVFMLLFISTVSYGQKLEEVSVSAYPGFTLVNFEKALGYSDDNMEDWDQFHISAAFRGFLTSAKQVQLGAEVAWQQLYYAYYIIPYGQSPVYREFNVTTLSVMALGRYVSEKFFAVGGAGVHFFNSGVSPAVCLEAGYLLGNSEKIKFPVSLRINPIFGSGTPTPVSIGAGLILKL